MAPAPRDGSPTTVLANGPTTPTKPTPLNQLPPLPDHYLVKDEDLGPCLHGLFRRQAVQTPDRVAVQSTTKSVTYRELNHATDQLASMLLKKGVTKNHAVGILMECRMEYTLSYIGIHKAGGAYLPLDPAYPKALLQDVLEDSQPTVVICTQAFVDRLPLTQTRIVLSDNWEECLEPLTADRQKEVEAVDDTDLDSLAYIVYSSGTTGKPKGIACPHRGSVYSYQYRIRQIKYLEDQEGLPDDQKDKIEKEGANVFFVWEMLRPLLRGQTLLIIPDDVIYDPLALANFAETYQMTRMLFTPSLLEAVLDAHSNASKTANQSSQTQNIAGKLASLTTIVLCGEVVTVNLQERTKKLLPNARIWNLYSVSECHDVACLEVTHGNYGTRKYCPVGKLMEGVEAHVMEEMPDGSLAKKPMGDVGELYVAGPTLAREYVGLGELTAMRFPTVDGVRLYKTGDRARVLANRELEILGRCDSMVKVRGYSVELRAIEAAIMTLTDLVSSCCVVVQGDEGEDKFVIAYIVLANADATCRKVRLALKAKLPHYMVPAFLVDMEELPTHAVSAKLDKKALPPVDLTTGLVVGRTQQTSTSDAQDCTAPRNDTERRLHALWCEIMSMRQIDVVFDSFFDIGGHSLLAARLVQRIQAELNVDVGVVELFSHATIEALSDLLMQKMQKTTGDDTPVSTVVHQRTIDLKEEVKAHDSPEAVNDIAMRAFWRSTHFRHVLARSVLLTGGTGWLGGFLLHELLQDSNIDVVYCLVRATSNAEAATRLQSSLQERQLWDDDFATRLQVFAGDTSLHHMGLDDDDYAMLGTGVDMVVHAAALVNLVYPYEGLRSANVQGTRNVIEFALYGRVKKLAYISTDAVFPDGLKDCREDAEMYEYAKPLADSGANGYSQTKWVAEMLVIHARERGLPTVVFRPGNMGGVGGVWNPSDINLLILQGCIATGSAPVLDGFVMEMTPVDFAAKAMVKIMSDNSNLGETFHVTNFGKCLTANEYFDGLRGAGVALESVSLEEWNKRVLATDSAELVKVRNFVQGGATASVATLSELSILNNDKFSAKCEAFGMPIPEISLGVMRGYLNEWRKAGIVVPVSPKNTYGTMGKPLAGKVALVTGASSGIGAAIAQALSLAGAKVGIGGRRLDRLKELASQLMDAEGADKVHPCKVDVTSRQEMETFCKECEAALGGPIDIFVNNAGVMFYTRLEHMKEEQWHMEVDVNCKGLLHATACVLPGMLARGSGHIVVTSSDAGRKVFAGLSTYSASKFFVEAFCQGMRLENADKGLKVTTIQPGDCKTELSKCTTDEDARKEFAQPSQDREFWLDPQDVAGAVLYAVTAPSHVGINEVLIEPRGAPA